MAPTHRERAHKYRETDRAHKRAEDIARREQRKIQNQKPKITIDEFSNLVENAVKSGANRQAAIRDLNSKYDIL